MIEGPLETLDRVRDIFLLSLRDNIGKADAAADFYLSAVSAKRRGYYLSHEDDALIKMFYSVMKEEEQYSQIPQTETLPDMNEYQKWRQLAGQGLLDGAYDDKRVVQPQANESMTGRHIEMKQGEVDDAYKNHNYFDSRFCPLYAMGDSGHHAGPMHDTIGDFYIPKDAHSDSQSQIDAKKEMAWEDLTTLGTLDFLRGETHYGRLTEDMTNHHRYNKAFSQWKNSNDKLEHQLKEQYPNLSDKEIDHELRKAHMTESKARWASNEVDGNGNSHNLGLMDYLLGLEWDTPKQKQAVYDHLAKYGASDRHRDMIDHGNITTARLKRNFQQRFSGLYNHWVRAPQMPGENIKFIPKPIPSNPTASREDNFMAFNKVPGAYDKALNFMAKHTGMTLQAGMPSYDSRTNKVSFSEAKENANMLNRDMLLLLLNINPRTMSLYETSAKDDDDDDDIGSVLGEWKRRNETPGMHPLSNNWKKEDSPFTDEEIKSILAERQLLADRTNAGRLARKWGHMHYGTFIDEGSYPDELTNGGEHTTLSTHWQRPFLGKGGMGKQANELFNILHGHTTLRDNDVALEENDDPYSNLDWTNVNAPKGTGNIKHDDYGNELSLLFKKQRAVHGNAGEKIALNTKTDLEGNTIDSHMGSMLGPFGQPTFGLSNMKGDYGRAITYKSKGDDTDAEENMNPHNVWWSGGNKVNAERHASSLNPESHNKANRGHYDAFVSNDKEGREAHHKHLKGSANNTLAISHPFMKKGGAFHAGPLIRRNAAHYGRIGSMVHAANPPLTPGRGVNDIRSPQVDSKPTAQSFDVVHSLHHTEDEDVYNHQDEKKLNALIEELGDLQDDLDKEGLTPSHKEHLLQSISDKSQEYKNLEARSQVGHGSTALFQPQHLRTEERKLRADMKAIAELGPKARSHIEKVVPEAFSLNQPLATLDANMRVAAKLANDIGNCTKHDSHGVSTQGVGQHQVEREMSSSDNVKDAKSLVSGTHFKPTYAVTGQEMAQGLGLDYESPHIKDTMERALSSMGQIILSTGSLDTKVPMMSVAQLLTNSNNYGEFSGDLHSAIKGYMKSPNHEEGRAIVDAVIRLKNDMQPGKHIPGVQEQLDKLGMVWTPASEMELPEGNYGKSAKKRMNKCIRAIQGLDSILMSNPSIKPDTEGGVKASHMGLGTVPLDKFGPNSHQLHSIYSSAGYAHEYGDTVRPTISYTIGHNGDIVVHHIPNGYDANLIQPLEDFWKEGFGDIQHITHDKYVHHTNRHKGHLNILDNIAPQFKSDRVGYQVNQDPESVAKTIGLANLTNPDILRKEEKNVPLLQPMHRIFKLEDLEHLKGFTGDWIVSAMVEGERGFVSKEDDKISSPTFKLSKEDKDNFDKLTTNNYQLDVIKTDEGYYIFDVIKFDDEDVYDNLLSDRIKILRGGLEGIENVHVPSASDTRLTDDAGLELTVSNLQESYDRLILRDANSTYMKGEMRHPKWVLLSEGNDVVTMVLERRGDGPYTYRLGTGPITQEEHLGDRGVKVNDDIYMDLGAAFDSPDKYNKGDLVRVNVTNVGESESSDGQKLYTVSGSDIIEEAEGEGLVSQETLSLLAKSGDEQWLCEVGRVPSGIRITMPQGDVIYKSTHTSGYWTVHSPLASSHYLIRMAESQRDYWAPVAGALLKADVEIATKEEVNESEGEGEPLIPPKKIKGTDHWDKEKVLVKGLFLLETMLKSGVGAIGQSSTGAMGLGIGYGTPIESPSGPTNLHDSKTMPDFDGQKREGEDSFIEPKTDDSEDKSHIIVPVSEGQLEISSEKAILHT